MHPIQKIPYTGDHPTSQSVWIKALLPRKKLHMADWIQGYIGIALVGEVFGFPILQSPPDVAQVFRTCQLHTAWQLLKENSGSEHPAALLWSYVAIFK